MTYDLPNEKRVVKTEKYKSIYGRDSLPRTVHIYWATEPNGNVLYTWFQFESHGKSRLSKKQSSFEKT